MSGARSGPGEHAQAISVGTRGDAGRIRRMTVGPTSRPLWQVIGHSLADVGGDIETRSAEAFTGIGFYARPPDSGGSPEVIAVFTGKTAGNPVIIAARDERTRKAVAQLEADETAIFTSKAMIRIKADGTIEIASVGGTPQKLVTKADFDAHVSWVTTHYHNDPVSGVSGPAAPPPPSPVYTTKLKAE